MGSRLKGKVALIAGAGSVGAGWGNGRATVVRAIIPQAELHLYATDLSSMTHGRATFSRRFRGYEEVPAEAAQKIIAEASKQREEVLAEA